MKSLVAQMFPGMELIPLMLLALAVAAVCSIVGFFAAFFSRTTARVCGGLGFGAIAVFVLLILAASRWDFGWLLFVLLEASPMNGVVYGSLLLSLIALLVPLRRGSKPAPDGSRGTERPRWWVFILAWVVALIRSGRPGATRTTSR